MALAVLRRFDITVLKDKSGAEIPAPGARVEFYRQGATLAGDVTVDSTAIITASSVGQIAAGNQVQVGVGGPMLTVTKVDAEAGQITVSNSGPSVLVQSGTRLILISTPRPLIYDDPFGTGTGSSFALADSAGRFRKYIDEERFDYVVGGTDVVIDAEGSSISKSPFGINALDYESLQDAVNGAPAGGVIYFPPGTYSSTSVPAFVPPLVLPAALPGGASLHLLGAGPGLSTLVADASTPSGATCMVQITADHQAVEGLSLVADPSVHAGLTGILVSGASAPAGTALSGVEVKHCSFEGFRAGACAETMPDIGTAHSPPSRT